MPPVHVTDTSTNEGDIEATRQLLEHCLKDNTYYCPRCEFSTPIDKVMIDHLAYEINRSFQSIEEQYNKVFAK